MIKFWDIALIHKFWCSKSEWASRTTWKLVRQGNVGVTQEVLNFSHKVTHETHITIIIEISLNALLVGYLQIAHDKYFDNGLKEMVKEDYVTVGKVIHYSIMVCLY